MSNDSSGGSIIAAFVVGAVAGAVLAILFAPASGEETRRKLVEKGREGRDRLKDAARAFDDARREAL
jgi:gas vesicle protein